jgi:Phosphoenolpyruvate carboxykinase (ATP)
MTPYILLNSSLFAHNRLLAWNLEFTSMFDILPNFQVWNSASFKCDTPLVELNSASLLATFMKCGAGFCDYNKLSARNLFYGAPFFE